MKDGTGDGFKEHCINEKLFFHFLEKERRIESDPAWRLKAPKIEKTMPRILTTEEVTFLLEQPSGNTPKELRDKAMLELLYATGDPCVGADIVKSLGSESSDGVCDLYGYP